MTSQGPQALHSFLCGGCEVRFANPGGPKQARVLRRIIFHARAAARGRVFVLQVSGCVRPSFRMYEPCLEEAATYAAFLRPFQNRCSRPQLLCQARSKRRRAKLKAFLWLFLVDLQASTPLTYSSPDLVVGSRWRGSWCAPSRRGHARKGAWSGDHLSSRPSTSTSSCRAARQELRKFATTSSCSMHGHAGWQRYSQHAAT